MDAIFRRKLRVVDRTPLQPHRKHLAERSPQRIFSSGIWVRDRSSKAGPISVASGPQVAPSLRWRLPAAQTSALPTTACPDRLIEHQLYGLVGRTRRPLTSVRRNVDVSRCRTPLVIENLDREFLGDRPPRIWRRLRDADGRKARTLEIGQLCCSLQRQFPIALESGLMLADFTRPLLNGVDKTKRTGD